jgi:hypothetical protein
MTEMNANDYDNSHIIDGCLLILALWLKDSFGENKVGLPARSKTNGIQDNIRNFIFTQALSLHQILSSFRHIPNIHFAFSLSGNKSATILTPSFRKNSTPYSRTPPSTFSSNLSSSSKTVDDGMRELFYSYDNIQFIFLKTFTNRNFSNYFEYILDAILNTLSLSIPSIRARAIRIIGSFVNVDATLITHKDVREAIIERFNDIAISVRDEAVKLVGSYVLKGYDITQGYLDGLLLRLRDKGTQESLTQALI